MQVVARAGGRTQRVFAAVVLTLIAALIPSTRADGTVSHAAFKFTGPGIVHAGREIRISGQVTNTSTDPDLTPEVIDRVALSSRTISFNAHADGVATCRARIPDDGNPALCPRRSQVGYGTVAGILGTPGQPADMFGLLSAVAGKYRLYNYKRRRGESARLIAVIETEKPLGGIAVNLKIPVSRHSDIDVDIPRLSQLPSPISAAYPRGTSLVVTKLTVTIDPPRSRRTKPYLWVRTPRRLGMTFEAITK